MNEYGNIKPIETHYKGYRCRSRLEARWLVLFDALKIPYEYEKEGFDLGEGVYYLPDIWLPDQHCWIEIKAPKHWEYHRECDLLARQSSCQYVLYVTGNPWPGDYGIIVYSRQDYSIDPEHPFVFALGRRDDRELWTQNIDTALCLNELEDSDKYPEDDSPRLLEAYEIARSARFEHGESPGGQY